MTIPAHIVQQIKNAAAEEWRGDYSMQAYKINEQSEAYEKMTIYKTKLDQSNEVIATIIAKVESEWPSDFSMQVYTFEQQSEDAIKFFEYENDAVPDGVLEEIKASAFSEWQGDYSMMLYTLGQQIEGWLEINS